MQRDRTPEPEVRAGPSPPYAPVPYRVRGQATETADTVTLTLVPTADTPPPEFLPGQFNMLYAFGVGEVAISLCGNPRRRGEIVHTIRSVGKITSALARLAPGEVVGVRGPYGRGWPLAEAVGRDVVVVAGGLGLAPLRPVLYELFEHRDRYGRIEIIYGARSPPELLYFEEIQAWRAQKQVRFQVTVDAAGRDWYGDVGLVTQRIPDARFEPTNTTAFVCGPEIMMRFTAQALEARGVPDAAIWWSMERNMKCAIGQCGHCQFGPAFVCRDGPVFRYGDLRPLVAAREV